MPAYDLPPGFTLDDLHPPGGSAIVATGDDAYSFTAGALSGTFTLTDTQIIFPEETAPAVLAAVQNRLAQVGQPKAWEVAIDDLRTQAGALVGMSVADVAASAAHRQTVLVLALWIVGALDDELKIRSLDKWLPRRRKKA